MANYSRSELKRMARGALLGNYTVLILAMLTADAIPPLLLAPFSIGLDAKFNFALVTYLVAAVIIKVLCQLLSIGVMRMHLLLAQEQQASYMDLFWAVRNKPDRFLVVTLLFAAVLCVPAVPVIAGAFWMEKAGSVAGYVIFTAVVLLFLVLELYVLYFFDLVYLYLIEHEEITAGQGLRDVWEMMRGNAGKLFVLQLSFIGWQLLGVCSLGIGMLWIQPYMNQTIVNFYLDLTGGFEKKGMHVDASVEGPVFL